MCSIRVKRLVQPGCVHSNRFGFCAFLLVAALLGAVGAVAAVRAAAWMESPSPPSGRPWSIVVRLRTWQEWANRWKPPRLLTGLVLYQTCVKGDVGEDGVDGGIHTFWFLLRWRFSISALIQCWGRLALIPVHIGCTPYPCRQLITLALVPVGHVPS